MPNAPSTDETLSGTIENSRAWMRFLAGKPGIILACLWGLAEGTLFFVVPDVFLSLVAILQPRRAWRHVIAATAGALLAGILLFGWALRDVVAARNAVGRVPFVTAAMFTRVDESYRLHGVGAVFLGPLTGTPYKLYAVEAPAYVGELSFLAATVPARAERFVVVCLLFAVPAAWIRNKWKLSNERLLMIHAAVWIAFYAFYWSTIGKH